MAVDSSILASPAGGYVITDKKALAKWRVNHDLHVGLIMHTHGLSKPQALIQAYHEGAEGLSRRLAPKTAQPEATK